MKKLVIFGFFVVLTLSLISFVYAETGSNDDMNNSGSGGEVNGNYSNSNDELRIDTRTKIITRENGTKTITETRTRERDCEIEIEMRTRIVNKSEKERRIMEFRQKIREKEGRLRIEGRNITIREL